MYLKSILEDIRDEKDEIELWQCALPSVLFEE